VLPLLVFWKNCPKDRRRLVNLVNRQLCGELLDKEIDALVYELYGLIKEEIALIENETA